MTPLWNCVSDLYLSKIRGWYRGRRLLATIKGSRIPKDIYASNRKLNLGCGDVRLAGYINVDALEKFRPDVVCDVSKLEFSDDNQYDLVRASHVLEHFEYPRCVEVLQEWRRVLRVGGYIVVCVPDFQALSWRTILQPSGLVLEDDTYKNGWMNGLFALDLPPEFRHKVVFTRKSLKQLLHRTGFHTVGELDYLCEEPFVLGATDDSCNLFSLNVVATKI